MISLILLGMEGRGRARRTVLHVGVLRDAAAAAVLGNGKRLARRVPVAHLSKHVAHLRRGAAVPTGIKVEADGLGDCIERHAIELAGGRRHSARRIKRFHEIPECAHARLGRALRHPLVVELVEDTPDEDGRIKSERHRQSPDCCRNNGMR